MSENVHELRPEPESEDMRDKYLSLIAEKAEPLNSVDVDLLGKLLYSESVIKLFRLLNAQIELLPREVMAINLEESGGTVIAARLQGQIAGTLSAINFIVSSAFVSEDDEDGSN